MIVMGLTIALLGLLVNTLFNGMALANLGALSRALATAQGNYTQSTINSVSEFANYAKGDNEISLGANIITFFGGLEAAIGALGLGHEANKVQKEIIEIKKQGMFI